MRDVALVVDDVEINREILADILVSEVFEGNLRIAFAADGNEALQVIEQRADEIAVILLDLMMPNLTGHQVLLRLYEEGMTEKIPVLVITSDSNIETEAFCLEHGAADFVAKPFTPHIVARRVQNVVELFASRMNLQRLVDEQTEELINKNARLVAVNEDMIELLGDIVEIRDLDSGNHVKRVKKHSNIIAKDLMEHCPEYGLDERAVSNITSAAALHDTGKIMIEDAILLKPGRLTPEEWERMQKHTTLGAEFLQKASKFWDEDYRQTAIEICRYHHERVDGNGYPERLVGDQIPISAQIVALADVWDALVNDRPYKTAIRPDKAREMIEKGECGVFSEKILAAFARNYDQFESSVHKLEVNE